MLGTMGFFKRSTDQDMAVNPYWARRRRGLVIRRTIGVSLIAALLVGGYWVAFHTGIPDTVMAMMAPMTDRILGPIDDSNGVLFGMAVFMATNIGIIMALFDDL